MTGNQAYATEVPSSDDLEALFHPQTVAIVGASEDTSRLGGGVILRFLIDHGFDGRILPINPKYDRVLDLECYASVEQISETIDVIVIAVPSKAVVKVLSAARKGQIRFALVISSGFGELGAEGRELEAELMAVAREKGISIIGPNAVGVVSIGAGFVATISQYFDRDRVEPGSTALVSQSGAFGTALLAQADREGLRFSHFVSSGNEVDLEFSDFGRYLLRQPEVRAVCGYIEGIRDGEKFQALAREAMEAAKPVVVLKVGSTEVGAKAAQSHTGSLAGSDSVAQAVFDAFNVIRADSGEEVMDLLRVFDRMPPARGTRIAILSHSGGAGVMAADAAANDGLELPSPSPALSAKLAEILPPFAGVGNPLDMTGGASLDGTLMASCMRAMLESDEYDAAVLAVNLIWRDDANLMAALEALARDVDKPFAVSWVAPRAETEGLLVHAPYPVFADPVRATKALARQMLFHASCRARGERQPPTAPQMAAGDWRGDLTSIEAQHQALTAFGVTLPREEIATSAEEAQAFQEVTAATVAMKIASPDIAHRTEIGCVEIGVTGPAEIGVAFQRIMEAARTHAPDARIDGILVQEMVEGLEVLVGIKRDPVFGPVVAVGPGGTLVEVIRQVVLRPAPLSMDVIDEMLDGSALGALLAGYRGQPPRDRAALSDLIRRVSWLAHERRDIAELDLNPVVVRAAGEGCVAVDYKFSMDAEVS